MSAYMLVLTTVPDEKTGTELGRMLVEERLAACATVSPAARSLYRWEGKLCDEAEHVVLIKTRASLYEKLENRIKALHPYRVPEIIAWTLEKGSRDYLDWLDEETKG
jgi:periplasmic divalent cation tolerance protein